MGDGPTMPALWPLDTPLSVPQSRRHPVTHGSTVGRRVSWEKKRKRRKFSAEFKAETVRLVCDSDKNVRTIARELDLTETAPRRWVQQAGVDAGRGPAGALTTSEREELAQLRRENKRLRMERDILNDYQPLTLRLRTDRGRCYIFGGQADTLAPPRQTRALWEHWRRPRLLQYRGGHVSFLVEREVRDLLVEAFARTGLLDRDEHTERGARAGDSLQHRG
jgi:transposase